MHPTYISVALLTKKVPVSLRHLTWYKSRHGLYAVKAETMEDIAHVWNCKELLIDFSGINPDLYDEDEELLIR